MQQLKKLIEPFHETTRTNTEWFWCDFVESDALTEHEQHPETAEVAQKNKCGRDPEVPPASSKTSCVSKLGFHEHDHQRKKNQRFNQRQTQNHHGLNLGRRTRIARRAFAGRRADARLSQRTANHCDGKAHARGDCFESHVMIGSGRLAQLEPKLASRSSKRRLLP